MSTLKEMLSKEEFVQELSKCETMEEALLFCKEKGVDTSVEELTSLRDFATRKLDPNGIEEKGLIEDAWNLVGDVVDNAWHYIFHTKW